MKNEILEVKLDEILTELGFAEHTIGTQYLRELVAWWRPGKGMLLCYGRVGAVYGCSPSAVERACRYAILRATGRLGYCFEAWNKYFGSTVNPETGAPTVSEFVSRLRRLVCVQNT